MQKRIMDAVMLFCVLAVEGKEQIREAGKGEESGDETEREKVFSRQVNARYRW